jgi:hypothetical protein
VLSCVQVVALRGIDPPSKKSYRLCKKIKKLKSGRGPTKGCRATDREIDSVTLQLNDNGLREWMLLRIDGET